MHTISDLCFQIEVTLVKDPTLGLGITGGVDGENSIKPGDTVSYHHLSFRNIIDRIIWLFPPT